MIGLIDWGIGGFSVLKSLRENGNKCNVVYFSDSGVTPYGKQTTADLRERFHLISAFMEGQGCEKVFIACNAASSALNGNEEKIGNLLFYSFSPNVIEYALHTPYERVAIIGGDYTINSGVYQRALKDSHKQFYFQSAQNLSAFVERGICEGEAVESEIKKIILELPLVEAVILACTHYPALMKTFEKLFPQIEFLDPSFGIEIRSAGRPMNEIYFYTTGHVEASMLAAKRAFGFQLKNTNCRKVFL